MRVQAIEIQPLVFVHRSFEHVRDMSMAKESKCCLSLTFGLDVAMTHNKG